MEDLPGRGRGVGVLSSPEYESEALLTKLKVTAPMQMGEVSDEKNMAILSQRIEIVFDCAPKCPSIGPLFRKKAGMYCLLTPVMEI